MGWMRYPQTVKIVECVPDEDRVVGAQRAQQISEGKLVVK